MSEALTWIAPPVPAGSSAVIARAADALFGSMCGSLPCAAFARASVNEHGMAGFEIARRAEGPWVGVGVGVPVRAADGDAVVRRAMDRMTATLPPPAPRTIEQEREAARAHQRSLNPIPPARLRQLDALDRGRRNRRTAR